jgi:gas vesicle protein
VQRLLPVQVESSEADLPSVYISTRRLAMQLRYLESTQRLEPFRPPLYRKWSADCRTTWTRAAVRSTAARHFITLIEGKLTMNGESRYFCFGAAVGVGAAILLTPKSGRETRAYLNTKARDGVEYVKARAEDARTAAEDVLDRSKTAIRKQTDAVAAAIDEGKQAYEEVLTRPSQS